MANVLKLTVPRDRIAHLGKQRDDLLKGLTNNRRPTPSELRRLDDLEHRIAYGQAESLADARAQLVLAAELKARLTFDSFDEGVMSLETMTRLKRATESARRIVPAGYW